MCKHDNAVLYGRAGFPHFQWSALVLKIENKTLKAHLLIMVVFAAAIASGCVQSEKTYQVSFNKKNLRKRILGPDRADQGKNLQFAISTMISPEETVLYYKKIFDYVAIKIDRGYDLVQKNTYSQTNDLFREGALDMAFISSGPYVDLMSTSGAELLAVPVVDGKVTYHSYIIVPEGSSARSIADLEGGSFAFVDPLSTTGRYYPISQVQALGRSPGEFFGRYLYSYSNTASIGLVRDGDVDGAAVNSLIFDFLAMNDPGLKSEVRIIGVSQPFGNPPIVVHASMPEELKERLREALFSMHKDPEGRRVLRNLNMQRFTGVDDSLYDSVRMLFESVDSYESNPGAGAE
jgi:phosphonate transport system substrate-binding protein